MCTEMFMAATFINNNKLDTAQEHNKGTGSASWCSLESGSTRRNSTHGRETQEHVAWKERTKDSVVAWFPNRPICAEAGWRDSSPWVGKEIKVGFLLEHWFSNCNVLSSYLRTLLRCSSFSGGPGRNPRFCISNRIPGDTTLLVMRWGTKSIVFVRLNAAVLLLEKQSHVC